MKKVSVRVQNAIYGAIAIFSVICMCLTLVFAFYIDITKPYEELSKWISNCAWGAFAGFWLSSFGFCLILFLEERIDKKASKKKTIPGSPTKITVELVDPIESEEPMAPIASDTSNTKSTSDKRSPLDYLAIWLFYGQLFAIAVVIAVVLILRKASELNVLLGDWPVSTLITSSVIVLILFPLRFIIERIRCGSTTNKRATASR